MLLKLCVKQKESPHLYKGINNQKINDIYPAIQVVLPEPVCGTK